MPTMNARNCSGRGVGRTSGLTVGRVSGPEFTHPQDHGAGGSVNRQTGGLTHTGTVTEWAGCAYPRSIALSLTLLLLAIRTSDSICLVGAWSISAAQLASMYPVTIRHLYGNYPPPIQYLSHI